jgi:hypothetical protein
MESEIQVYHHLGLGDHIICNGLIRELCKNYDKIYCFVKEQNYASVSFMYRDEPKIELISVKDDFDVSSKAKRNVKILKVGFENLNFQNENFDKTFYDQLGYDFSLRWKNFFIERDTGLEKEFYHKLNPHNSPYIFIHDDPSRGFLIDLNKINIEKGVKIIKSHDIYSSGNIREEYHKFNLFHWILTLENSKETHCMDSSFKCLIESLPNLKNTKLFFHRYVRGSDHRSVSSMKKNWMVIDDPSLSFQIKHLVRKCIYKFSKELRRIKVH